MEVHIPKWKGAIFDDVRPTEKHCESILQCMHRKINNGISATSAADGIAPDWPVSH